jgi:hypothetical protein
MGQLPRISFISLSGGPKLVEGVPFGVRRRPPLPIGPAARANQRIILITAL